MRQHTIGQALFIMTWLRLARAVRLYAAVILVTMQPSLWAQLSESGSPSVPRPRAAVSEVVIGRSVKVRLHGEAVAARLFAALRYGYSMHDRQWLAKRLKELDFQATDLADPKTAVAFGKQAGVQFLIAGKITQQGDELMISIRELDVQTGEVTRAAEKRLAVSKGTDQVTGLTPAFYDELARELLMTRAQRKLLEEARKHHTGGANVRATSLLESLPEDCRTEDVRELLRETSKLAACQEQHRQALVDGQTHFSRGDWPRARHAFRRARGTPGYENSPKAKEGEEAAHHALLQLGTRKKLAEAAVLLRAKKLAGSP